jgi:two-component system response regulator (stage 0 sporulation protein A)
LKKLFNVDGTVTITMTEQEYFNSQFGTTQPEISKPEIEPAEVDLETEVTDVLSKLGMPRSIKGFSYIREAVIMSVGDPRVVSSITKQIYPAVAKRFNTTPQRAERSIRHAIEVSFNRGNAEGMDAAFGYSANPESGKLTNSEFIATIADNIRLRRKKGGGQNG